MDRSALMRGLHKELASRSGAPTQLLAPYTPTPEPLLDVILDYAELKDGDVLLDLGCGDARLLCRAADRFSSVRGIGYDIDEEALRDARARISASPSANGRVSVSNTDVTLPSSEIPWETATVVFLYLSPKSNVQLRAHLLSQLRVGTRVVCLHFNMGSWKPERSEIAQFQGAHSDAAGFPVYVYRVTEEDKAPNRYSEADDLRAIEERAFLASAEARH